MMYAMVALECENTSIRRRLEDFDADERRYEGVYDRHFLSRVESSKRPEYSESLRNLIKWCLKPDPKRRPDPRQLLLATKEGLKTVKNGLRHKTGGKVYFKKEVPEWEAARWRDELAERNARAERDGRDARDARDRQGRGGRDPRERVGGGFQWPGRRDPRDHRDPRDNRPRYRRGRFNYRNAKNHNPPLNQGRDVSSGDEDSESLAKPEAKHTVGIDDASADHDSDREYAADDNDTEDVDDHKQYIHGTAGSKRKHIFDVDDGSDSDSSSDVHASVVVAATVEETKDHEQGLEQGESSR